MRKTAEKEKTIPFIITCLSSESLMSHVSYLIKCIKTESGFEILSAVELQL